MNWVLSRVLFIFVALLIVPLYALSPRKPTPQAVFILDPDATESRMLIAAQNSAQGVSFYTCLRQFQFTDTNELLKTCRVELEFSSEKDIEEFGNKVAALVKNTRYGNIKKYALTLFGVTKPVVWQLAASRALDNVFRVVEANKIAPYISNKEVFHVERPAQWFQKVKSFFRKEAVRNYVYNTADDQKKALRILKPIYRIKLGSKGVVFAGLVTFATVSAIEGFKMGKNQDAAHEADILVTTIDDILQDSVAARTYSSGNLSLLYRALEEMGYAHAGEIL